MYNFDENTKLLILKFVHKKIMLMHLEDILLYKKAIDYLIASVETSHADHSDST
jgi:hypothetical protein